MSGFAAAPGAPADRVLASALALAASTGSRHAGVGHLMAAMIGDESTVVSRVLREAGVTRERVVELFGIGATSERTGHVSVPPMVHATLGLARGLALAHGATEADATHVLLALVYSDSGGVVSMWRRLGVSPADLAGRLALAGVRVPPVAPPQPPVLAPTHGVIFPLDDLQPVLRAMLRRYPPGSGVRWGWNTLDDDRAVIYTDRVAPVEEVVTATVATSVRCPSGTDRGTRRRPIRADPASGQRVAPRCNQSRCVDWRRAATTVKPAVASVCRSGSPPGGR